MKFKYQNFGIAHKMNELTSLVRAIYVSHLFSDEIKIPSYVGTWSELDREDKVDGETMEISLC